jgi:hypothetical protein
MVGFVLRLCVRYVIELEAVAGTGSGDVEHPVLSVPQVQCYAATLNVRLWVQITDDDDEDDSNQLRFVLPSPCLQSSYPSAPNLINSVTLFQRNVLKHSTVHYLLLSYFLHFTSHTRTH